MSSHAKLRQDLCILIKILIDPETEKLIQQRMSRFRELTGNDKVVPPQSGFSDEGKIFFYSRIFFAKSGNAREWLVVRIIKFSCGLRHSTPPDSLRPLLEVLAKSGPCLKTAKGGAGRPLLRTFWFPAGLSFGISRRGQS